MKKFTPEPLIFPIGDHEYSIPPVDYDTGLQLAAVFALEDPSKSKLKTADLFRMAMGKVDADTFVWDRMRADGAPFPETYRAGMACLAHFQTLLRDPNPATAYPAAVAAAEAVWESGVRPEDLAARVAATTTIPTSTPMPSTPPVEATTTQKPGYLTGTRKTPKKQPASRSRGSRSSSSGS